MLKISVGISDLKVVKEEAILDTQSLGSCVGITLFDPIAKVSGLAHIMLPDSKNVNVGSKAGKYADTAIKAMIAEMVKLGAAQNRMIAKIAGGACMFSGASISDFMNIGARNVTATKKLLAEFNIKIVAEDTGGNYGRTVEFNTMTGKLVIKCAMNPTKEI